MSFIRSLHLGFAVFLAAIPQTVLAVDGVVLVDQNRALAGNVTPGDLPGFPVTISQPGSYRLSGNLTVTSANVSGIEVRIDAVTIDLNGFSITGPGIAGTGVGIKGIFPEESLFISDTTVVNGTVRRMGNAGLSLGTRSRVEGVRALENAGNGISVWQRSYVVGNIAESNSVNGVLVQAGSTVRANTASSNGSGIVVGCPSSVIGNTASGNAGGADLITAVGVCTRDQNTPAP